MLFAAAAAERRAEGQNGRVAAAEGLREEEEEEVQGPPVFGDGAEGAAERVRYWFQRLQVEQRLPETLPVAEQDREAEEWLLPAPPELAMQHQVLLADVPRTRAELDLFGKQEGTRRLLIKMLQYLCNKHAASYSQGLNEVLAPFVWLADAAGLPERALFDVWEAFVLRYAGMYFVGDDATCSAHLDMAFSLVDVLLHFHDPGLAVALANEQFAPPLYSTAWFMTTHANSTHCKAVSGEESMRMCLRLYDWLLWVGDASFIWFFGLALLERLRQQLLFSDSTTIPEVLKGGLRCTSLADVDAVAHAAVRAHRKTPRSFLSLLHYCASGQDLPKASPGITALSWRAGGWGRRVCNCVLVTAHDLLSPAMADDAIVIDVRSDSVVENSGGGTLPRALRLSPQFMADGTALSKWIDHFETTSGSCQIVIVDQTTVPAPTQHASQLWKRLLLGVGDGEPPVPPEGHAFRLAKILQSNGLKYVSVLDSGYVALVEEVRAIVSATARPAAAPPPSEGAAAETNTTTTTTRGASAARDRLEPYIVGFDHARWEAHSPAPVDPDNPLAPPLDSPSSPSSSAGRKGKTSSSKRPADPNALARLGISALLPSSVTAAAYGRKQELTGAQRATRNALVAALARHHRTVAAHLRQLCREQGVDVSSVPADVHVRIRNQTNLGAALANLREEHVLHRVDGDHDDNDKQNPGSTNGDEAATSNKSGTGAGNNSPGKAARSIMTQAQTLLFNADQLMAELLRDTPQNDNSSATNSASSDAAGTADDVAVEPAEPDPLDVLDPTVVL